MATIKAQNSKYYTFLLFLLILLNWCSGIGMSIMSMIKDIKSVNYDKRNSIQFENEKQFSKQIQSNPKVRILYMEKGSKNIILGTGNIDVSILYKYADIDDLISICLSFFYACIFSLAYYISKKQSISTIIFFTFVSLLVHLCHIAFAKRNIRPIYISFAVLFWSIISVISLKNNKVINHNNQNLKWSQQDTINSYSIRQRSQSEIV